MEAAFPKTDPFEPPRAEKGEVAAAKPEREEFAKVSEDFDEAAASGLFSSADISRAPIASSVAYTTCY